MSQQFGLLILCIFVTGCHFFSDTQIKFINEQVLPHKLKFKKQFVGGLSAVTMLGRRHILALSDDKKNHRFYQFQLGFDDKKYKLTLKKQMLLREAGQRRMKRNMDPEGMDFYRGFVYISSEGQKIFKKHDPPQIFRFSLSGRLKQAWSTPKMFQKHTQNNKGFESLNIKSGLLWTSTEQALENDPKDRVRITGFSVKTQNIIHQYYYPLTRGAGLTDLLSLGDKRWLVLERIYDKTLEKGRKLQVYLFQADCRRAYDLANSKHNRPREACKKKKIFDFSKLPSPVRVNNLEGLAFGPKISKNERLLIFVSDDNFNKYQQTQFLFFHLKSDLL